MTAEPVGLDEPFSVYHAQFPVPVIVQQLSHYNNPPLFEIILHYWMGLFGISPVAVRALPVIMGALAPVALFRLSRHLFSASIALVSALILTFSTLLQYYSHDCRAYPLFVLLAILNMHAYLLVLKDAAKWTSKVLHVIWGVTLIYTHYFGFIVLFIQALHLIIWERKYMVRVGFQFAAIVFLYLPHAIPLIDRMGDSVSRGTWVQPPSGLESLYNALWAFCNMPVITVCVIGMLVAWVIRRLISGAKLNSSEGVVTLWFFLPYLGMFLVSYLVPMYITRYLIFALPAFCMLITFAMNELIKARWLRNGVWLITLLSFGFTLELSPDKKQPVDKIIARVKQLKSGETTVIVNPHDFLPVFAYHFDRRAFETTNDRSEYHSTDSLLRAEDVFHVRRASDLPPLKRNVIYLAFGERRNSDSSDVYSALCTRMNKVHTEKIGDNWQLTRFNARN
jgi:mannosyltransferase